MSRPFCRQISDCKAKGDGHCRGCSIARVHHDPEMNARRLASIRANFEDPDFRAAHVDRACATLKRLHADPAFKAANSERGRHAAATVLNRPDVRAKSGSPESRKLSGQKTTETRMAWCPADRREEYRALVYSKGLKAADARRMIEADIVGTAEHAKRAVANSRDAMRIRHQREKAQAY